MYGKHIPKTITGALYVCFDELGGGRRSLLLHAWLPRSLESGRSEALLDGMPGISESVD